MSNERLDLSTVHVSTADGSSVPALDSILNAPGGSDAPGSRYGTDVRRWAPVAVAAALIVQCETDGGPTIDPNLLDEIIGYVVNDSDSPARTVVDYGAEYGIDPAEILTADVIAVAVPTYPNEGAEMSGSKQATCAERTIESITRLKSSVNGNPRFRIDFTDGSSAQTQSDAMFGYAVGNPGMREGSRVSVRFTRAGRISHMNPVDANGTRTDYASA